MSIPPAILYEHARGDSSLWRLSGGDDLADAWWQGDDLRVLADRWPELSRAHRASLKQLAIIARSTAFLFDVFPRSDVGGSTKRSTLAFRLEADLPHSAEELMCDFQFGSTSNSGSNVSAVASPQASWSSLLEQIELSDCRLELVAPKSLVLLQAVTEEHVGFRNNSLILLHVDGQFEIVGLKGGQVILWRLPSETANAARDWQVLQEEFSAAHPVVVWASREPISHAIVGEIVGPAEIPVVTVDEVERNRQFVSRILGGKSAAWFDLARDAKCSGSSSPWRQSQSLNRGLLLIAGCLLVAALACYWRAERVRGAVAQLKAQQTTLVRSALPEQKITSAVMARLKSEHAKLTGSRTTNKNIELPITILPVMRQVISGLPTDLPISVHELRLNGREIYLDVELGLIQDAAQLAQSLQASGLNVSPPSTSAVKNGKIRAQFHGTRNESVGRGAGSQP